MLGLREQVGGHHRGAGGLVGDHRDLGRAGQHVDADLAVELPLRLGDEGVARPDDHVGGDAVQQPEGHRGQRLDPAEGEDPLGAGGARGVEDGRVRRAVVRRRGGRDDVGDARGPGDADGHEGAGQQREPAGRQVGADVADGHVLLAADDARHDLVLEVGQVRPLHAREPAGALGARVQGVAQVLRQRRGERADLVGRDLEVLAAGPAVQLLGVAAHRGQAVLLDVEQHRRHRRDDGRVRLGGHVGTGGLADDGEGAGDPVLVGRRQVHTYNIGMSGGVWQPFRGRSCDGCVAFLRQPAAGGPQPSSASSANPRAASRVSRRPRTR